MLNAHEYCLTIIWHASFSEREGDWGSHGMFMPGIWLKKIERKRERSHAAHATQPRTRIVMPGMKMNEKNSAKKNSCLRNPPLASEK